MDFDRSPTAAARAAAVPLRAVIYCRVSQDRRRRGRSVAEQEAECRQVCDGEGWRVVRVFVDNDVSASRYARQGRPDFEALVAFLDAGGADVLVYWEGSRTQRDLRVYVDLRDLCMTHGILWNYSGRTFDLGIARDRHATAQDAVSAEHYSDETSERVLRSARANAQAGRPHGKGCYGYRREYDPATRELLGVVEHPAQAAVLREAARRVLAGESLYAIEQDFASRGIEPPGGSREGYCPTCRQWLPVNRDGTLRRHRHGDIKCPGGGQQPADARSGERRWSQNTVRRLLLNPAYIGKRVHNGQVVADAVWPPILAEADWYALRELLTEPSRRTSPREGGIKHLLSGGIALCDVCDGKVFVQKNRGQLSYTCKRSFHVARKVGRWRGFPPDRPSQWADRFESIDDYVVCVVIERMRRPDILELLAADDDGDYRETLAQARLLRARLQEHYDEAAAGRLSAAGLAAVEARLLPQIQEAERRAKPRAVPTIVADLVRSDVADRWASLTLAQQRAVISTLMEVRIVRRGRGNPRAFDPDSVKIVWKGTRR